MHGREWKDGVDESNGASGRDVGVCDAGGNPRARAHPVPVRDRDREARALTMTLPTPAHVGAGTRTRESQTVSGKEGRKGRNGDTDHGCDRRVRVPPIGRRINRCRLCLCPLPIIFISDCMLWAWASRVGETEQIKGRHGLEAGGQHNKR
jgi:hypothetical protein